MNDISMNSPLQIPHWVHDKSGVISCHGQTNQPLNLNKHKENIEELV